MPSTNGENGRTANGKFAEGNPGGPGNPHAKKVAKLRAVLLEAVTEEDMRAVVDKLVEQAKEGELAAIKVILERVLGRPAIDASPESGRSVNPNVKVYLPHNGRDDVQFHIIEDGDWYGNRDQRSNNS